MRKLNHIKLFEAFDTKPLPPLPKTVFDSVVEDYLQN